MKTHLSFLTVVLISLSLVTSAPAKIPDPSGIAITIYNDNFAVVKERRIMDFEQGINTVRFTDVASSIDPTSVNFKSLRSPDDITILEQNYEYDLVNTESLLKRYLDKEVQIFLKGSGASPGSVKSGTLKAAIGSDLIISNKVGGMDIISRDTIENISLAQAPDDLVTKPTLVWLAQAKDAGSQPCQVTYTTGGINWKADYSAVLNDTEDALDLTAWVTVNNQSGAGYKDATLKLIAGDVRRVQTQSVRNEKFMPRLAAMDFKGGEGFEEKEFMDYHMYTLGRKSTVNNNQVKQIELMPAANDVAAQKLYVYQISESSWLKKSEKVQIKIEFDNKEENKLGIALPKGKVRVFKKDPADGTLEFVGEDTIDHTARKEKVSLYIGDAFDIVAEDKIIDSQTKNGSNYRKLTHQVQLRNRKDSAVTVYVDEICHKYMNMEISNNNIEYNHKDAYTARFAVPLEADSTDTLTYTVTYTW